MVKRVSDIRCSMAIRPDALNKYLITRVTNSVDYCPGEYIEKDVVKKLINEGWTISVLEQ
jgi:hypothetical protein